MKCSSSVHYCLRDPYEFLDSNTALLADINCSSEVGPDKVSVSPDSGVSWPTKTVNANNALKMRVFVGV